MVEERGLDGRNAEIQAAAAAVSDPNIALDLEALRCACSEFWVVVRSKSGLAQEGKNQARSLTMPIVYVTIDTMGAKCTISDLLRKAILDSRLSLLRIANETGVERASLSRFVAKKRTLRLDMADKLAEFFGLTLTTTGITSAKIKKKG